MKPRTSRRFFAFSSFNVTLTASTALALLSGLADAQTWNGAGGDNNWGTGANWTGGSPIPSATTDISFSGSTQLNPNNNYTAFDDFRNILFNSGAGGFVLGGSAIDLFGKIENNSAATQTVSFATIALNSATANEFNPVSGNLTVTSASIVNNGNQLKVFGNNGFTLTFGTGTTISGTGSLAINQNSIVIFQRAQTYSGDTFVNAGALQFAENGSANSSILRLGDTIANSPAATISITDTNGGTTIGSTIVVRPSASGAEGTRTISATNSSGTNTYSGVVALDAAVTVTPTTSGGTLAFTGSSFQLKTFGALFNGAGTTTVSGPITSTGVGNALTKSGSGTLTLSGTNTYDGATSITLGTLQLGSGGTTGSLNTSSPITLTGTLAINRSNAVVQGTDFNGAALTGAGGFTQNGSGTTTLNVANTYTGATTINAGTLKLVGGSAIANTSAVVFGTSNQPTLDLNGTNETIGSLANGGAASSVLLGANTLTVGGDGTSTSYAGVLHGTGGLSKIGAGTQTLATAGTSANTATTGNLFSGGIILSAGALTISTTNASGTGLISVTGGTLNVSAAQLLLTGGITINGGTANLTAADAGGLGTVTLTTGTLGVTNATALRNNTLALNGGTFTPNSSTTIGALNGSTGFNFASGGTFTLGTNNAAGNYGGVIGGAFATNLVKQGSGTQILSGGGASTGTFTVNGSGGTLEIGGQYLASTGTTAVQAGTLKLNFNSSAATSDLIKSAGLTVSGGTLSVVGKNSATDSTQNFTSTTLTASTASNIGATNGSSMGLTAINLGGLSRGVGSGLNFNLPTGTQTATNGILTTTGTAGALLTSGSGPTFAYTTVNRTDFAAKDALTNNIVALAGTVNAGASSLGGSAANSNVTGGNTTLSGAANTINTIRFNDSTAARTLNLGASGNVLTITTGGILISSDVGAAGSGITGGQLRGVNTSGAELIVHQNSSQPFTIGSVISNPGIAQGLTKTGAGTLILTGVNTHSGITYITSGRLQIGAGGSLANSTVQLAPNDPTAVFDLNNQSVSIAGLQGGGATGGHTNLGASGQLIIKPNGATYSGSLVGGVDSVITLTGATGVQGFQTGSNLAYYGTINVNASGTTGGIGVFSSPDFRNATINLFADNKFTVASAFATTYSLGNLSGSGTVDAGSKAAGDEPKTYNLGYLGGASTFSGVLRNGTGAIQNVASVAKYGNGTMTLSGANTYTGATSIYSGGLTFDYTTGNIPLSATSTLTLAGGTVTFKGAASGAGTLAATNTFNVDKTVLSRVVLDNNTNANGVTLTLKTATLNSIQTLSSNSGSNILFFDTSSSSFNALKTDFIIGAADSNSTTAIRTNNGILVTGASNVSTGYKANVLIKDSGGIGFATNNGTTTISRYTGTALPSGATATLDTGNYTISNTTVTRIAQVLYNTLQLDSSTAAASLSANFDTFTRLGNGNSAAGARGILATGANGASITSGGGSNQTTYFYNYQTGSTAGQTLTLNMPISAAGYFNGTGLTVATGLVTGDVWVQSGVLRQTQAQSGADSLTGGAAIYRLYGGVLEIGADLSGSTSATSTADFTRAVGGAAGQVHLIGDTGFSAFGGTRTVNLGGATTPRQVVWGSDGFLVSPQGTSSATPTQTSNTEGGHTFKLSSSYSDSTIEFQNPIAFGSITRTVDVAQGDAPVDARLSGVLSGVVDLTATLANSAPAVVNAAAGLTKTGSGTLELTAPNTYNGPTTIKAGTLTLSATGTFANSNIIIVGHAGSSGTMLDVSAKTGGFTIGSAQRLSGIGTIDANDGVSKYTVTIDGVHAPGNSPGTQTVDGNLSYSNTSIFEWDLAANKDTNGLDNNLGATADNGIAGTDYDSVTVTGNLSINAAAIFKVIQNAGTNFADTFWTTNQTWSNIFNVAGTTTSGWSNTPVSVFNTGNVLQDVSSVGSFTITGSTLTWSAVPEPTSALASLLLGAGLLRRRRA